MFSIQAKCYLKKYLVPRWAHEKFRFRVVGPWSRPWADRQKVIEKVNADAHIEEPARFFKTCT